MCRLLFSQKRIQTCLSELDVEMRSKWQKDTHLFYTLLTALYNAMKGMSLLSTVTWVLLNFVNCLRSYKWLFEAGLWFRFSMSVCVSARAYKCAVCVVHLEEINACGMEVELRCEKIWLSSTTMILWPIERVTPSSLPWLYAYSIILRALVCFSHLKVGDII